MCFFSSNYLVLKNENNFFFHLYLLFSFFLPPLFVYDIRVIRSECHLILVLKRNLIHSIVHFFLFLVREIRL